METPAHVEDVIQQVARTERLAEELLTSKHQVVEYDRRRNANRQALGELKRKKLVGTSRIWSNFGDMFLLLPRQQVINMVEKDQTELSDSIDQVRDAMQAKAGELRETEGKPMSKGWGLKGMAFKEMSGSAI